MKMMSVFTRFGCVAASLALSFSASTAAEEDGFVSIFNGKDLEGWTPSKENPESYSVKDGVLIVKGGRSHLFYTGDVNEGKFTNFELKLRIKTLPGANSGVYFHTAFQEEGWPNQGFECQVNSTHKDPKKTGSLYGIKNIIVLADGQKAPAGDNKEMEAAPSTDGEWFDYHITVKDKKVRIKVNGETTVEYTEPAEAKENKNFKGRKIGAGTFAIQAHDPDSEIHYELIEVKPLD